MRSRSGAGDATDLYGGLSALGGKEEELPREIPLIVLMATLSWTSTSHTHVCTVQCSAVESIVKPMLCLPRRTRALVPRGRSSSFLQNVGLRSHVGCCSAESYSQILWGFVRLSQPHQRILVTNQHVLYSLMSPLFFCPGRSNLQLL